MADKEYDSDASEQEEENLKGEEKVDNTPPEDVTLTNPDVITKYQEAAKIAQGVLIDVVSRVSVSLLVSI
jgi:hypothetical protein